MSVLLSLSVCMFIDIFVSFLWKGGEGVVSSRLYERMVK